MNMKLFMIFCLISLSAFAVEEEESEALRALRISCEKQKVGLGCFNYANMLVRIEKSDDAEKYYEMGCKLSHEPSCAKEKWDLPERKAIPEIVELPASPAPESVESEQDSEDGSQPTAAISLPSRVSIRQSESEQSSPQDTINTEYNPGSPVGPSPSQESPADMGAAVPTQNEASSGPVDLNSAMPDAGMPTDPSVTE